MSKSNKKLQITVEQQRQMTKSIVRKEMVEQGFFNRSLHKIHKDGSEYSRKEKHKKDYRRVDLD